LKAIGINSTGLISLCTNTAEFRVVYCHFSCHCETRGTQAVCQTPVLSA